MTGFDNETFARIYFDRYKCSMKGEPIESVKSDCLTLIAALRLDPYALETVCISIITFDREVHQILPLTELADYRYLIL